MCGRPRQESLGPGYPSPEAHLSLCLWVARHTPVAITALGAISKVVLILQTRDTPGTGSGGRFIPY